MLKCQYSQFPQLLAELPSIRVDASYRVVTEEQLLKGGQAVQGAAVHLRQAVVVQVTAGDKKLAKISITRKQETVVYRQQDVGSLVGIVAP